MSERFSASVAGRHIACHASANLDLAIPHWTPPVDDPNADNAANRGRDMHELFANMMKLKLSDMVKMQTAIEYVAQIRERRRFKVLVEYGLKATWLPSKPMTTVDLGLYVQDEIHVFDLKTGKIPVEVVDNSQLLFYAVSLAGLAPKAKGAWLHILQPWAGGNTSWFADTATLKQFMARAIMADQAIQTGSTVFHPGDHCQFCEANPHSRGRKGAPLCPVMLDLLYPRPPINEDEILAL